MKSLLYNLFHLTSLNVFSGLACASLLPLILSLIGLQRMNDHKQWKHSLGRFQGQLNDYYSYFQGKCLVNLQGAYATKNWNQQRRGANGENATKQPLRGNHVRGVELTYLRPNQTVTTKQCHTSFLYPSHHSMSVIAFDCRKVSLYKIPVSKSLWDFSGTSHMFHKSILLITCHFIWL